MQTTGMVMLDMFQHNSAKPALQLLKWDRSCSGVIKISSNKLSGISIVCEDECHCSCRKCCVDTMLRRNQWCFYGFCCSVGAIRASRVAMLRLLEPKVAGTRLESCHILGHSAIILSLVESIPLQQLAFVLIAVRHSFRQMSRPGHIFLGAMCL